MTIIACPILVHKPNAPFIALSFLVCLVTSSFPAYAFEVIVVNNAGIKPHLEAIEALKSSCGCTVKEIDLRTPHDCLLVRPEFTINVGRTVRDA